MFCDICNRQTRFGVVNNTREVNVRGVMIPVTYRAEVCGCCGEERYDDDLEIDIMKKAVAIYREREKLIPADQISHYMEEHGLSAEQMAERVNCAVSDIVHAAHGDLVTTELNKKLKKAAAVRSGMMTIWKSTS